MDEKKGPLPMWRVTCVSGLGAREEYDVRATTADRKQAIHEFAIAAQDQKRLVAYRVSDRLRVCQHPWNLFRTMRSSRRI